MAKKPKGKAHPAKLWTAYKVEGDKLTRTKQFSPKAGKGYFMAEHKDRRTCGKTGYMEKQ